MPCKIMPDWQALARTLEEFRRSGKTIVFTNGCFDLLHVGHVRYLTAARSQGDVLVLGLNSDASVRAIKGEKRPVVPQEERAEVVAGLACVDFVTLFDAPDPLALIQTLKPDVLVKGADWAEDRIIGADVVKAGGGRVARIDVVPGASTTGIIERIVGRYAPDPGHSS
ncbi:D-glycero-beta-D-manno-heptose 1-phosphate adeny lyltransferase [Desulfonema ishimotonii]|uniref:D-glycero-beta-D-manno-heptose 1-phosphate adenylyltransferase n=1 Tax=Desulfonema ishimotonii TaxID=45657 RepID=A0A401FW70_9BACT|nr:D-glycero-beta-D-manno-heptose 1-phosphate adenylyltransferase [Desulfonema ishimotonii]GBC61193.1 D-glycero-beta-D-manno-heptose 1-phosphate adeny lyltransferase [Desulfonema ishimotonii]